MIQQIQIPTTKEKKIIIIKFNKYKLFGCYGKSMSYITTPFVVLIFCLTLCKIDLEKNSIHYFCINMHNPIIKILNYIILQYYLLYLHYFCQ